MACMLCARSDGAAQLTGHDFLKSARCCPPEDDRTVDARNYELRRRVPAARRNGGRSLPCKIKNSTSQDCGSISSLPRSTAACMTSRADLSFRKQRKCEMSKQAMRDETERLVKEALERKTLTVKQGKTRIDSKCRKCGALNRVSAAQGQVRVPYTCKECCEEQRTF